MRKKKNITCRILVGKGYERMIKMGRMEGDYLAKGDETLESSCVHGNEPSVP
jgi:hypothetical protein